MFELYIGIKNKQDSQFNHEYNGDRLQFDLEKLEFEVVAGNTQHSDNQLWRFERALGLPKGVHTITAVNANKRLLCEEREGDDGEVFMNVDFTEIDDDSASRQDPDSMSNYTNMMTGHYF